MRLYYQELKLTGLQQAAKHKEIMERTCIPKWKGLRFIWGDHYSDATITDEQAIRLLKNKGLNESDFKKLPEGYLEKKPETWDEIKEEIKPKPVKRQPKKK